MFSDYRLDSDGNLDKLRASASELLGLYTLLRHLFTMRLQHRAELKANWDSFDACCQVLDIIHACKKKDASPRASAPLLRQKISSFMEKHKLAYGTRYIKPKHAWQWAIPDQFEYSDHCYDAFKIESSHLAVKKQAARLRNLKRLERTILAGFLNTQISNLRTMGEVSYFVGPTMEFPELPLATCGKCMVVGEISLRVDDVVIIPGQRKAGVLIMCLSKNGIFYGLIEFFSDRVDLSMQAKRYRCNTGDRDFVRASDLTLAALAL